MSHGKRPRGAHAGSTIAAAILQNTPVTSRYKFWSSNRFLSYAALLTVDNDAILQPHAAALQASFENAFHLLSTRDQRINFLKLFAREGLPPLRWCCLLRKAMQECAHFGYGKSGLLRHAQNCQQLYDARIVVPAAIDPPWRGQQANTFVVPQRRCPDTCLACDLPNR